MKEEVIDKLLSNGTICNAEFDSSFNVTFLTTQIKDEGGTPIEVIFDDSSDRVISVVGRVSCSTNTFNKQPALLLSALWLMNEINEQIIENESVGFWSVNSENGRFLYTASIPIDSPAEALISFCNTAIQTYLDTYKSFTNVK